MKKSDIECEEEIQAGLYVLDVECGELLRFDDHDEAWSAFRACETSCGLIHREDGLLAERWLIEGEGGEIVLEEIIYDDELETIEL